MSAEYIKLYKENPEEKKIKKIINILKNGGIIIYPTDTVYSIGCDINNQKSMEHIAKIKNIKLEKTNFSFICKDLSEVANYTKQIENNVFKLMKKCLPGPYTFILEANNNLPKYYKTRKEIGIRIPDNKIILDIVHFLGNPISSTSVYDKNEIVEYTSDAEIIYENFKNKVDLIIDGGQVGLIHSTVINTINEIKLIREGLGSTENLF